MKTYCFDYDEIFETDPNNPDHTLMKLPEVILQDLDLKEGDKLSLNFEDEKITIRKVINE